MLHDRGIRRTWTGEDGAALAIEFDVVVAVYLVIAVVLPLIAGGLVVARAFAVDVTTRGPENGTRLVEKAGSALPARLVGGSALRV